MRIDGDDLDVRFGPWRVRTRLDNVISAQPTGPLTWWRALGTRLSFVDHGLTFGSSTHGGVGVRFAHPVTGMDPFGLLRHPGLIVTVATPAQLVAQLDQVRQPGHGVEQAASSRTDTEKVEFTLVSHPRTPQAPASAAHRYRPPP